ncbi:MAG: SCO family protein [Gammaproteobacteria bacterium]|nr:SCO family protein [Gammaproteobacteria bacterium]
MNRLSLGFCACLLLILATIWWQGTRGFQAFTSEAARRLDVLASPVEISDLTFKNQNHENIQFANYKGKVVLVDFIYTNCPVICNVFGHVLKSIETELKQTGLEDQVQIVNITFDPEQDTPQKLNAWLKRYNPDLNNWQGLRLEDPEKLPQLLAEFGIVVIPNEFGGYDHNAAIHILDQDGHLTGIYNHQAQSKIVEHIRNHIATTAL